MTLHPDSIFWPNLARLCTKGQTGGGVGQGRAQQSIQLLLYYGEPTEVHTPRPDSTPLPLERTVRVSHIRSCFDKIAIALYCIVFYWIVCL